MKLNTRTIALATVLGVAGVANAQFRYFFAYGDADFATLQTKNYAGVSNPAAAVGVEIPTNAPVKVWKAGDGKTFKVSVYAERISGNADDVYAGGSVQALYDTAPVANSTTVLTSESTLVQKKIGFGGTTLNGSFGGWGTRGVFGSDGSAIDDDGDGNQDTAAFSALSRGIRGEFTGNTTSPRRVGLSTQFQMNPSGKFFKVAVGEKIKIVDLTFKSNLAAWEVYGDDGAETGLNLFVFSGTGTANGGSSTFIGGANVANAAGSRLTLQAVPEPGTVTAILAGLAAVALRRRSK